MVCPPDRVRALIFGALWAVLAGCALRPSWHWEKPGASDEAYTFDLNQCKAANYQDASGMVTKESVRRMFACMERKGWSRVDN